MKDDAVIAQGDDFSFKVKEPRRNYIRVIVKGRLGFEGRKVLDKPLVRMGKTIQMSGKDNPKTQIFLGRSFLNDP